MSDPSPSERKAFLRVLTSLAWADGVVADEELAVIHLAANELHTALSERDLEERDLDELAAKVTHPELRALLLDKLAELARADHELDPDELATIKFFSDAFQLPPPALEGVDWDTVSAAGADD